LQFSAIRLMATGSCRVPVHEFIIGLAELTTERKKKEGRSLPAPLFQRIPGEIHSPEGLL
jgi:hypothetical protein